MEERTYVSMLRRDGKNNQMTTGKIEFTFKGHQLYVELRETYEHAKSPWGRQQSKARAYTHVVEEIDFSEVEAIAMKLGTGVYSSKGEYPELDKAWRKFNKAEAAQMKEILEAALPLLGLQETKFKFSTKAGCACGCSPGFVALDSWPLPGYYDLFFGTMDEDKKIAEVVEDVVENEPVVYAFI